MCNKHGIENYPPLRVKIKETFSRVSAHAVIPALLALSLLAASCVYDHYNAVPQTGDGMTVELNIRTRAITSNSKTYEVGSTWENYIDIAGGDYKIYFFTYNPSNPTDADTNNTLISEFQPLEMTDINGTNYTQYTLSGEVDKVMAGYSDFKIVVLANWGAYPDVTAGTTTIDALVEGDNSTFLADTFLTTDGVSSTHLIPFFGVREYSGINWKNGWRITLEGNITLLRAVAKVEVVMSGDSDFNSFDSVSIAGYNSTGYCAPKGVYLRSDYDSGYTDWAGDFANTIHLVGGANDSGASSNTYSFNRQEGADTDTWTIYLPEYDNTSASGDYSFIQVKIDGEEYEIHFANYSDGETENTADYDIFRNYLYRFSVKILANHTIRVFVNKWEEVFDNEYEFNDDEEEP